MHAILCFGDSITFGRGEQPAKGWCGRLKEWWESQNAYNAVYNLGIPGDTTIGLLKRLPIELEQRANYIHEGDKFQVIIAIGTNDLSSNGINNAIPLDIFRQHIEEMLAIVEDEVNNYFVLQIPPVHSTIASDWEDKSFMNKDVNKYNLVLQELAKDHFVSLSFTDWDDKVPDGVHPNSQGYQDMFEQIKKIIKD